MGRVGRWTIRTGLAVAMLFAIGCSGGGGGAEAASSTASSGSTSSTIATTSTTLDAAQQAYLTISSTASTAVIEVQAQYVASNGNIATTDYPAYCGALVPIQQKYASDLQSYTAWPPDAQDEIDAQVAADAAVATAEDQCAHLSPTDAAGLQAQAAQIAALDTAAGAAASATRVALGLPVAPP